MVWYFAFCILLRLFGVQNNVTMES